MPDREYREDRLEEELRELGRNLEYPPTPDVSQSVRDRIEGEERSPDGLWSRLPSAKWAAAAAVVAVMASPFFSPAFRDAASDVFVFGQAGQAGGAASESEADSAMSETPTSGDAEPDSSGSPSGGDLPDASAPATSEMEDLPASSAGRVGAEGITLDEANSRLEGLLLLPGLGEPDEIYAVGRGGVMLVYDDPGLTFTQRPGDIETAFPATTRSGAEYTPVDGGRGYWRSPGVLFWERGGVALRLQSGLPKGEAVRLAGSAR